MHKVYLSPSTQDKNIGCGVYGSEEYRMNMICDVVEELLKKNGITTYRNKPEMSLSQVVMDSNSINVDIHVAIHSNASGNSPDGGTARGCEVLAYSKESKGYTLAEQIYKHLSPLTPTADRGVKITPGLYETRMPKAPAVIIEVAFHDNKDDALWIIDHIDNIGEAITKGVLEYLGVEQGIDWKASYKEEVKKRKEAEAKYNSLIQRLRIIE